MRTLWGTICFSNKSAGKIYGIRVLTTDLKWVDLLEGVTKEEARELMRTFNGRPVDRKWRVLRTGYKRMLEIIAPLRAERRIISQPFN